MSDGLSRQERLTREVHVNSAIFVGLKKQYELAKLDEVKNITIVNILDPGRAPVRKARPTRLINSGLAFLGTLIALSIYFGLWPHYSNRLSPLVAIMWPSKANLK